MFFLTLKLNISLSLSYVPSESNLADEPARIYSDSDCSLSPHTWSLVCSTFGLHTHDMMAIPSNVMKDSSGQRFTFFSQHPVPHTSGVNVFAQLISPLVNYYVFPPFVLVGPPPQILQLSKTLGDTYHSRYLTKKVLVACALFLLHRSIQTWQKRPTRHSPFPHKATKLVFKAPSLEHLCL